MSVTAPGMGWGEGEKIGGERWDGRRSVSGGKLFESKTSLPGDNPDKLSYGIVDQDGAGAGLIAEGITGGRTEDLPKGLSSTSSVISQISEAEMGAPKISWIWNWQ